MKILKEIEFSPSGYDLCLRKCVSKNGNEFYALFFVDVDNDISFLICFVNSSIAQKLIEKYE